MAAARHFRVLGGHFTVFEWQNNAIALLDQVAHTSPTPVAQAVPIQPLDSDRPLEIITTSAISMGTVDLRILEVWGERIWQRLAGFGGATDLADIFGSVAATANPINMKKYVRPPHGSRTAPYYEIYHNCVVTDLQDGETVAIAGMQVAKQLSIGYTHVSRGSGGNAPNPAQQ